MDGGHPFNQSRGTNMKQTRLVKILAAGVACAAAFGIALAQETTTTTTTNPVTGTTTSATTTTTGTRPFLTQKVTPWPGRRFGRTCQQPCITRTKVTASLFAKSC